MFYSVTSTIVFAFSILIAVVSVWLVVRNVWFIVWLKATFAISLLVVALLLVLVGLDLKRYQSYRYETPLAKLTIKRIDSQSYHVVLAVLGRGTHQYRLNGDMWQLDARLITWKGPFATFIGATPGYRLERISGRYSELEQEINSARTVFAISESESRFDLFAWLLSSNAVPWIDAKYGSSTYLPLQDGAEFTIAVGMDGLLAKPVNAAAIEAVENWQ